MTMACWKLSNYSEFEQTHTVSFIEKQKADLECRETEPRTFSSWIPIELKFVYLDVNM